MRQTPQMCHFLQLQKKLLQIYNYKTLGIIAYSFHFFHHIFYLPFQSCPLWAFIRTEQFAIFHWIFIFGTTLFTGSPLPCIVTLIYQTLHFRTLYYKTFYGRNCCHIVISYSVCCCSPLPSQSNICTQGCSFPEWSHLGTLHKW